MDIESLSPGYFLAIPPPPLSPWLRLAHIWRVHLDAPNADEEVALRSLRDWQLFFQLEGDTWFAVPAAGGHVPLPAGSIALLPPGLAHGWAHYAGAHMALHFDLHANPSLEPMDMLVSLRRRMARGLPRPEWTWHLDMGGHHRDLPLVWHLPDPAAWQRRLQPLVALYGERRHRDPEARLMAAGILAQSLSELLDLAGSRQGDPLLHLLSRAARRPANATPVAALAAEAGLGETAFRAAVRRLTGCGPREYLETLRVERACYALRSGAESIAAIAEAAGYADPFHFSRVFHRVTGMSPSDYRRQ